MLQKLEDTAVTANIRSVVKYHQRRLGASFARRFHLLLKRGRCATSQPGNEALPRHLLVEQAIA